jgi:cytochrome b subunit of formate dehydrogenase
MKTQKKYWSDLEITREIQLKRDWQNSDLYKLAQEKTNLKWNNIGKKISFCIGGLGLLMLIYPVLFIPFLIIFNIENKINLWLYCIVALLLSVTGGYIYESYSKKCKQELEIEFKKWLLEKHNIIK